MNLKLLPGVCPFGPYGPYIIIFHHTHCVNRVNNDVYSGMSGKAECIYVMLDVSFDLMWCVRCFYFQNLLLFTLLNYLK